MHETYTDMARDLAAQLASYQVDWITTRNPPGRGTYMISCINPEGAKFLRFGYWNGEWADNGVWIKVQGWYWSPNPVEGP